MLTSASTHDVTNQPPPIVPYNVFEADLPLSEALEREGDPRGGLQSPEYRNAEPTDVVEAEGVAMAGPGGAPQEGRLNQYGQAGYYNIEAGECKVTFPDLDKDAWE